MKFFNKEPKTNNVERIQLVTERGNGFFAWDGRIYQSDIVRSCVRPFASAAGKLVGKHIRRTSQKDDQKTLLENPEAYIRFLLEEPNPYMSGQKLREKLATQLCLNNNAFALIIRDDFNFAREIYPIPADGVEARYNKEGNLYLRFFFNNSGKIYTFPYTDVIHLRSDFYKNDIFGESIAETLVPLMDIVNTTDQGIVKAIKNGGTIKWLLKTSSSLRDEDKTKLADEFATDFLSIEKGTGVAITDGRVDAQQLDPKDYVPNATQMEKTVQRIYSLFGTNEKIIQSRWSEDEYNAYYESKIEPFVIDLQDQYTFKIFTRRERGCGNQIVFDAGNLTTASMSTKLNLRQMVDIGVLSPNEWRAIMNLPPIPDGDRMIRRKDTGYADEKGGEE